MDDSMKQLDKKANKNEVQAQFTQLNEQFKIRLDEMAETHKQSQKKLQDSH